MEIYCNGTGCNGYICANLRVFRCFWQTDIQYFINIHHQQNHHQPWREVIKGVGEDAARSLGREESRGRPQVFLQVRNWTRSWLKIEIEETGFLILISFWVMCHQKGNTIMIFMMMMTFMVYFAAGDNTSEKGGSEGSCRERSWKPVGHCGWYGEDAWAFTMNIMRLWKWQHDKADCLTAWHNTL